MLFFLYTYLVIASFVLVALQLIDTFFLFTDSNFCDITMRNASDNMAEKQDTAMIEDRDRDSVSLNKEALATVHHIKPGMTAEDVDFLNNMPAREQAGIYHKVDRRLVPMLALLYLIGMEVRLNVGSISLILDLPFEQPTSTEPISAMRRLRGLRLALEWLGLTTTS